MKKVLIISYYWPPAGGITVLRCLKFVKYLRDFGWEPVVFTADNAHYPSIDKSNIKDVPEDIEIIKQKIWEPYGVYKFITGKKKDENVNNVFYTKNEKGGLAHNLSVWIRSNYFIPDARCFWIEPSVKTILNWLSTNKVDAIFSDGPPHTNTRIATLIKKKTGIPWLADFQDPWTQVDYYSLLKLTKRGDRKHRLMEQEVFELADKITIVSNNWKTELETIGAKNVSVVPYGYDPDDFHNLVHKSEDKFIISHIGIMGYDRNPAVFLSSIKELVEQMPAFENKLRIKLAGQVDFSVVKIIKDLDLEKYIEFVGNVERADALQLIKDSHLLLLLLNKQSNSKGRIPGKLFEYLAVKRNILCLGDTQGDAADIIRDTKSGTAIAYSDKKEIKKYVENMFVLFQNKQLESDINSNIENYSNRLLTNRLASYLDEISSKPSAKANEQHQV